jgi:hypothetical protein
VLKPCLLLALGSLAACAGSGGLLAGRGDWPAYAAEVYALQAPERLARQAEAASEYAEQGGADRAIRLAILTGNPDASEQDFGVALDLLDEAEAGLGARNAESRQFIAFLRPLLLALQSQRTALAAESLLREALEEQLEELKTLEETLNASATDR